VFYANNGVSASAHGRLIHTRHDLMKQCIRCPSLRHSKRGIVTLAIDSRDSMAGDFIFRKRVFSTTLHDRHLDLTPWSLRFAAMIEVS